MFSTGIIHLQNERLLPKADCFIKKAIYLYKNKLK